MDGRRVLVLDNRLPAISYKTLRAFFDVVIAVGERAAQFCVTPDIFISQRTDPHVDGVLDLTIYSSYQSSILCVTQPEIDMLKKIAKYHSSYVLVWQPMNIVASDIFGADARIPYGLSVSDPGLHLARASGAADIYAASIQGTTFEQTLDVLINEKRGYIPANILRPTRPQFLEEARFTK
jgi:hypothetical protein